MAQVCEGCGEELTDGGPVGLYCGNDKCDYEFQQVVYVMKQLKEKVELARLKAKYEEEL